MYWVSFTHIVNLNAIHKIPSSIVSHIKQPVELEVFNMAEKLQNYINLESKLLTTSQVSRDGIVFYVPTESQYGLWWTGGYKTWESLTVTSLNDMIQRTSSKCVISIGEWIGPVVIPLAVRNKNVSFLVFDLDSISNAELLLIKNWNNLQNINLYNYGVSNSTNFVVSYQQGDSMSSFNILKDRPQILWKKPVLDILSLSQFIEENNCVMKIDIEGHEEFLFESLIKIKPKALHLTLHLAAPHHVFYKDKENYISSSIKLANLYKTDLGSPDSWDKPFELFLHD
jgi:hypothetical protein